MDSIKIASADLTANGQMVAAYLQNELNGVQQQEDAVNAEIKVFQGRSDTAQVGLLQDQNRVDLLNPELDDLINDCSMIHVTPAPF